MADLVERLREIASYLRAMDAATHTEIVLQTIAVADEAADHITALEAEIARKDALMEKVAQAAIDASARVDPSHPKGTGSALTWDGCVADYRRSIRALSASEIMKGLCGG